MSCMIMEQLEEWPKHRPIEMGHDGGEENIMEWLLPRGFVRSSWGGSTRV